MSKFTPIPSPYSPAQRESARNRARQRDIDASARVSFRTWIARAETLRRAASEPVRVRTIGGDQITIPSIDAAEHIESFLRAEYPQAWAAYVDPHGTREAESQRRADRKAEWKRRRKAESQSKARTRSRRAGKEPAMLDTHMTPARVAEKAQPHGHSVDRLAQFEAALRAEAARVEREEQQSPKRGPRKASAEKRADVRARLAKNTRAQ